MRDAVRVLHGPCKRARPFGRIICRFRAFDNMLGSLLHVFLSCQPRANYIPCMPPATHIARFPPAVSEKQPNCPHHNCRMSSSVLPIDVSRIEGRSVLYWDNYAVRR